MEDIFQWIIAFLIGVPITAFLAWFDKSGFDFNDGFGQKIESKNK